MKTIRVISFVLAIVICIGMAVYSLMNPEMTHTQLFLKWWWVNLIALVLAWFGIKEAV